MLNRIIIALGLLIGSLLTALGASSTLSNLSSGTTITGTDLFYDVQTIGVGGVKVTGSQIQSFIFGNVSGSCTATMAGVFNCTSVVATATTGIGAGTNITTSGTASNVTINVVATPTFNSITTTIASVTGWLTAAGVNMQTASVAGNLTAGTAQFTGQLTGTTGVFQTVTVNSLTPTGPNCLQETGGVIQATNATCGTGSGSVTSVTSGDGSVNINPTTGTVIVTLGVGHANTWTAAQTFNGGLTATNGSIAALTGSNLNFVSGTITTLTSTNAWMTNLTATGNGSIAALTGSNVNFVSGTITTLTNTNHWTTSLTSTNGSITTLTGGSATFQTVTVNSLTPTGPNCLQETGGVVQATNAGCSASVSTVKGGPLLPSSEYLGGGSGLIFPNFYIPNTNTSGAGALEGVGYIATATIATATLQFNMPETIPTGNARLRILQMANATTGTVQYTISDAVTSPSNSLGTVTMNFEGVTSIAQTTADALIEKKILLTVTPTANQIMSVLIGTTSSVAQTITYQPTIVWE